MAGIGLVLRMHDHKLLPKWPFDISINVFVSVLSIVSRTTLMVPLTSCIGQLKWLWIKRERPLADLQFFDEASRGPLGALKLFYRTKGMLQHLNTYIGDGYAEYCDPSSDDNYTLRGANLSSNWDSSLKWNPNAELLHIAFVSLENLTSLNATECIFEMCVKSYTGSVENNLFQEKELRILNTTSNEPLDENESLCLDAKHDAHLSLRNSTFCITRPAFWSNQELMYNTILGLPDDVAYRDRKLGTNTDVLKQLFDFGNIPSSMRDVASSVTRAIREAPAQHNGIATKAFHPPGTYIKVHWWWLALPVALQAMTLVFLVVTFCRSRIERLENWKSSSLAVFRSGILSQGDFGMTKAGRQYEIDDIAGQVKICSRYTGTSYTVEQTNSE
ncbi:hypothetical protein SLS54_004311 [Diplodia seriata]